MYVSSETFQLELSLLKTQIADGDIYQLDFSKASYEKTSFCDEINAAFTRRFHKYRKITQDTLFPKLKPNFFTVERKIAEKVYLVSRHNTRFLMKGLREGAEKTLFHEYFVGINIPPIQSFSRVLGLFSTTLHNKRENYILYEYIAGKTLFSLITENDSKPSVAEIWLLVKMVYQSVLEAHRYNKFIHQDLHFENILVITCDEPQDVTVNGQHFKTKYLPKIIDYGRACIRTETNYPLSVESATWFMPADDNFHDLAFLLSDFIYSTRDKEFAPPVEEEIAMAYGEYSIIYTLLASKELTESCYKSYDNKYDASQS